jgi:hypothetical protein
MRKLGMDTGKSNAVVYIQVDSYVYGQSNDDKGDHGVERITEDGSNQYAPYQMGQMIDLLKQTRISITGHY